MRLKGTVRFLLVMLVPLAAIRVEAPSFEPSTPVDAPAVSPSRSSPAASAGVVPMVPAPEVFRIVTARELEGIRTRSGLRATQGWDWRVQRASAERGRSPWYLTLAFWLFYAIIALICVYVVRHYIFTLTRLLRTPRQPYVDVDTADWPPITVLIPAHNEETVIGDAIAAVLEADYPRELLTVMPVDDRSSDRTGEIVASFEEAYPDTVRPFRRTEGPAGKAAALRDAMEAVETEVVLVFDADYVPGRGLLKQLVAPFFDPEVGATMGRVVPFNTGANLLTRLLDLERTGGYQVDQQARMNLRLVPQYGGTVGGVRRSALEAVGGWRQDALAEDTDATYRLLLGGWKTVYQNRSECYEQVPERWDVRIRQIKRWARGHNQAAARYVSRLVRSRLVGFWEKLDGLLLLGIYTLSPVVVLGWALGVLLWYLGELRPGILVILLVTAYSTLGNFATFSEVAAAAHLDGSRERIRLLPFIFINFLVSLFSVTVTTMAQIVQGGNGTPRPLRWHRTKHEPNGRNGNRHGYVLNSHTERSRSDGGAG